MQLALRSPARMTAGDIQPLGVVDWNRQVYQRLKLAFRLGLRRQIFVAVCDDLARRNALAMRLHSELAQGTRHPELDPRFVSLTLELSDPNPIAQVQAWLAQHRTKLTAVSRFRILGFQILGIDRLTRESASIQWTFLDRLRSMPEYLPTLESSLLLWVSRPWLYSIEQSAPEFWRCCTGIFEFTGEPGTGSEASEWEGEITPLLLPSSDLPQLLPEWREPSAIPNPPIVLTPAVTSAVPPTVPPTSDETPVPPASIEDPIDSSAAVADLPSIDREVLAAVRTTLQPKEEASEESLYVLQELEQLHQMNAPAAILAQGYAQVGDIYRDRFHQSRTPDDLHVAICAYQRAEEDLKNSPQANSLEAAAIANELGALYWMRSGIWTDDAAIQTDLTRSLQAYQSALLPLNPQQHREAWSSIHNNLGSVRSDLARTAHPIANSIEQLQLSAHAFEEALRYQDADAEPEQYASTQNNLGTAYWHLAQYQEPVRASQQAIAAYDRALDYYTRDRDPMAYATIQNNLGTAYWHLSQHERPAEHLPAAIAAYRQALIYRTPQTQPAGCAATQNNLGTACWHLAQLQSTPQSYVDLMQQAIAAYDLACELAQSLTESTPPFDCLTTQNNLGLIHYQLATYLYFPGNAADRQKHLETALDRHLSAIAGWQQSPDRVRVALDALVQVVRAFYNAGDIRSQNLAFARIPSHLLSDVMRSL
jgi:tetratricopeptide (TPR) repeat protein